MSDKKQCKDLTHHLPLTRTVVSDDELKNLFNCEKELTTKDYELLINSKVHVDDIYEKKEVDAILEYQQGQLNNHEVRISELEIGTASGGGTSNHTHDNKDVLDVITYSGTKAEVDLYAIEDMKSNLDTHYADEEKHVLKSEKDGWNITSEKVTSLEADMSYVNGELVLKATKTELSKVEAKIDGIAIGTGNLLRNSDFRSQFNLWQLERNLSVIEIVQEDAINYCHIKQDAGRCCVGQLVESFEQGVNYTLSFTGRGVGELFLEIHQRGDGDNDPIIYNAFTLSTAFTKHSYTFRSDTDALENSFYLKLGAREGSVCDMYFSKIKFERGDSATGWTPHSSDVLLEVDELENALNDLKNEMNSSFKDGIITEAECKSLEERIENLNREKVDVKAQADTLLMNTLLVNTTEKDVLLNSLNSFEIAHAELVDAIRRFIEDKKITTEEKNSLNSLTNEYIKQLSSIRVAIQNATTKISEKHSDNAYQQAHTLVMKEVGDVEKTLNSVRDLTDNIFMDGIVSVSEAQSLKVILEDLEKEKTEMISQIDEIQLQAELSGTLEFLELGQAEDVYVKAHKDLIEIIALICEDGRATKEEIAEYKIKLDLYKQSLVVLKSKVQKALDKIISVKMETSLNNAKDYADQQVGELNKEIKDLENLTNEAFKDGILTVAEKEALKIELKEVHKEQADVLAQVDALANPHLSPELLATTELMQLLTTKDKFVNNYRALSGIIEDLLKKTLIGALDRERLDNAITQYTLSLRELREQIQISINKIADVKAKNEVDKIKDNIVYKLEIFSTKGGVFKNGIIETTLQAKVYFGKDEITYNFLPTRFRWSRVSNDIFADDRWNLSAPKNYEIDVTDKDVVGGRTTFNCELLDEEGNVLVSAY